MPNVTIYHNPRCSKSRQALALLQASGRTFTIHEYLKHPLDATQVRTLLQQTQCAPSDFIRHTETDYHNAGLAKAATLSTDDVIHAIVQYPKLMQRPIVASAGKAVIARPPEKLQEIL